MNIEHGSSTAGSEPGSDFVEKKSIHVQVHNTINEEVMLDDGYAYDYPEPNKDEFASFYREHCIYLLPMLGWFVFSSALSLYNKYVFGKCYMAFPCPLLMTSVHFSVQWLFSYLVTKKYSEQLGGEQLDNMSWGTYLWVAIPCGLVTSFDVGLSNLALVRITLTFYTMVKSSSPIFVVLSAFLFGIEKITWALILTVIIITVGEFLTVMGEVEFDLIGFILVLSAAVLSGMRWTLVQLQLESLQPRLKSTLATMRILSPFMFISMLFLSICFEEPWKQFGKHFDDLTRSRELGDNQTDLQLQMCLNGTEIPESYSYFDNQTDALWTLAIALFGASLAICMILCEFYLIMNSSAVVLMIGGVCKELTTIMLGVAIFGDKMNFVNVLGCAVVFSGVLLYKLSLHMSKNEKIYDTVDVDSNGSTELRQRMANNFNLDYSDHDENENDDVFNSDAGAGANDWERNDNDSNQRKPLPSSNPNQQPLVHNADSEIL